MSPETSLAHGGKVAMRDGCRELGRWWLGCLVVVVIHIKLEAHAQLSKFISWRISRDCPRVLALPNLVGVSRDQPHAVPSQGSLLSNRSVCDDEPSEHCCI